MIQLLLTRFRENKECSIKRGQDNTTRLNHEIRAREVRLIDEHETQIGIVTIQRALDLATQAGLDLVEISPQASPPVCKILDWGKYSYKKTKQIQKGKKKQKSTSVKQVRFGLKIGENDFNIKLKKIRDFLDNGNMVKVTVFFRGREMAHTELGSDLLSKITSSVSDIGKIEQDPTRSGKQLAMVLRSTKNGNTQ